jgi:RNA polymerase sigma-70 factor, ECF subfamily
VADLTETTSTEETPTETTEARTAVARAFRDEWGRIVAALIRITEDWDLAEECAQEAVARALHSWPRDGTPQNPGAWLTTAARNHAINQLRRNATETTKLQEVATKDINGIDGPEDARDIPDDRLRLIFTCCHPALPLNGRVALTLRTLAGLTTLEIARAFLVSEKTMAQRLVRTKRKIQQAGIPYRVPPAHLLPERTTAVLGVVYLLFNEGYSATTGDHPIRRELCAEAIHLGRTLAQLMPDEPEVLALLALMLLHDSRRAARLDDTGDLMALADQDRDRWDRQAIAEGVDLLDTALRRGAPGPYQIQAAITACHATAPTAEATDWAQIAALYDKLVDLVPTPVVRLNRAVAIAMTDGPEAGLRLVQELADSRDLPNYHLLPATRADLLRRLGQHDAAAETYREALNLAPTDAERRYLSRRLTEMDAKRHGDRPATPNT